MPAAIVNKFPIIRPEEGADCALIALAFYLGEPYDDVLRVVSHVDMDMGKEGLTTRQIKKVAEVMGHPLRLKRTVNFDDDYGIVLWKDHATVIRNGLLFESNGTVWEPSDYFLAFPTATAVSILIAREPEDKH
jgi:hypothetical protein